MWGGSCLSDSEAASFLDGAAADGTTWRFNSDTCDTIVYSPPTGRLVLPSRWATQRDAPVVLCHRHHVCVYAPFGFLKDVRLADLVQVFSETSDRDERAALVSFGAGRFEMRYADTGESLLNVDVSPNLISYVRLGGHDSAILCLCREGPVQRIDLHSGVVSPVELSRMPYGHHPDAGDVDRRPIDCIAVEPVSGRLLVALHGGSLEVWDFDELSIRELTVRLCSSPVSVGISRGGRLGVAASEHEMVVLSLDTDERVCTFSPESNIRCCAVSEDGKRIVVEEKTGLVHGFELAGPVEEFLGG